MPMRGMRAERAVGSKMAGLCLVAALCATSVAVAGEWTHWRGPDQTGVSAETGLIDSWSLEGENLIWRQDFVGRSTPVVVDGRVCANGRVGEGIERQEAVACWDAETGKELWKRGFNVYHTAVPWNRVGWGDLAADAETGYVYAQFVNGRFAAFDAEGKTVWEWRLGEDFGRFSGYGGRTNTPIVDENRVIAHVISASWGTNVGGGDRWVAFDKKTGDILWVSEKGGRLKDLNTYSSPIIADIDGRRQLIGGGADGFFYGIDSRTGESLWKFHLSQRGLNSSPVEHDGVIFAAHSEENLDTGVMGRVVAFDVKGASGDITKTAELWRVEALQAGYVSAAYHDGRVYIADNSANLHAINAKTGESHWHVNYGTVGKGSPVIADGKIYITEVNGHVRIIKPGDDSAEVIHDIELRMPDEDRYAEVYGSFAIAGGRLFFTSEEGVYCLGDKNKKFAETKVKRMAEPVSGEKPATTLQVVPNVKVVHSDETVSYKVFGFDGKGRPLGETANATFTVEGEGASITEDGVLTFDGSKINGTKNFKVTATLNDLKGVANVRVAGPLPWSFDFEAAKADKPPIGWMGVGKGAKVRATEEESNILVQPKAPRGAPRATMFFGPSDMTGYTVQADVKGNSNKSGRRVTDLGVVNGGYTMEIQGAYKRIQIQSWTSERRMMKQFPFEWEVGPWYTLKMRVDAADDKAVIRGKVWKRGEEEPADWMVTVEDPLPINSGSPGVYTFAPVEAYFDNVKVYAND